MDITAMTLRDVTSHVSKQGHAMAGATIASAAALGCALGEVCVRISQKHSQNDDHNRLCEQVASDLGMIRSSLLASADEDGAAITTFANLRDAGRALEGQDRLCAIPVEIAGDCTKAAEMLQDFRTWVLVVGDDLEMAITLLVGSAQAATLLLDSNLRIWPQADLVAKYEPQLATLRDDLQRLRPVSSVR